jgi:hypothetical protein
LKLEWSDDDTKDDLSDEDKSVKQTNKKAAHPERQMSLHAPIDDEEDDTLSAPVDLLAQQMKFTACLRMMADELATLALCAEVRARARAHLLTHTGGKRCTALSTLLLAGTTSVCVETCV